MHAVLNFDTLVRYLATCLQLKSPAPPHLSDGWYIFDFIMMRFHYDETSTSTIMFQGSTAMKSTLNILFCQTTT